ncbi:probable cytochrome P450 6a14 isoform X2 [Bemisia tabaci]|uniref:probable cytochrome P450 6a14 isoform X2 n=1 Tax=Bemisia tabaci TaxID=7038 RepID=UPI003B280A34
MSEDPATATQGPVLTENIMVGIISSFLSVGYETMASVLAICLYEVALHQEVQQRLFQEISQVRKEAGGEITFDDTKKLQFMEQVMSETLRKYPVATTIGRCCTEPFQMPDSPVVVEKGILCFFPTLSLHHDPKYFPEPEKFDPDRFAPENLDKIVPGSYLPFGDGPRSCIASRMVLMVFKTVLITMISNYTIHSSPKTPKKLEFDGARFLLTPKGNLWLRIRKRK